MLSRETETQQEYNAGLVEPSFRPSSEQSPRGLIVFGAALLLIGCVTISLDGIDGLEQALLIIGSILVVVSLIVLRPAFRAGFQQKGEPQDIRKLYGTNKA